MSEEQLQAVSFSANVPGVTEEEFQKILAYWNARAKSVTWREWKGNPFEKMFEAEGKKSYKIRVVLKEE